MSRIDSIVETLKQHDDAYFNAKIGLEILSDDQYDLLRSELLVLDPNNEYFKSVGADTSSNKVSLPTTMGSLNQLDDDVEIKRWLESSNNNRFIISDKLDGFSVLLKYENGELVRAYSRGDGRIGQDITKNIKHINDGLPIKINANTALIRGEVILSIEKFTKLYSNEFKNARNMVAGIVNRKISAEMILSDLSIVSYELLELDGKELDKEQQLSNLSELGFLVVNYLTVADAKEINETDLSKLLFERKSLSKFELDGLVITAVDCNNQAFSDTSSSLNPKHSFKFKRLGAEAYKEVKVVAVLWDISKSGFIKPRVQIVPTQLGGVVVTFVTGFNGSFIANNKIGPGAVILLSRNGDVIPYINKVVTPAKEASMPSFQYEWNSSNIEIMVPDHDNNPDVKFKQVLHFFNTLDVELLKEATLFTVLDRLNLTNASYEDMIREIIELYEHQWVKIIGVNGSKIFNNLHMRLAKLPPEVFLGGLRYFGVGIGVRKCKLIMEQVDNIHDIKNLSVQEIVDFNGFDTITANQIIGGIDNAIKLLESLSDHITIVKKKIVNDNFANLNVVLTGFRDNNLKEYIEMNGGKVSSGVSKNTTHLICSSIDSNSSKFKKAKELNVKIMTLQEFKLEFML